MLDDINANTPSRDDETPNATLEYLNRAAAASSSGDAVLSMHLYLAAFEQAVALSDVPSEDALRGLKQAWALACANKERSLAEYIYEKMEPYLTQDEMVACMSQLQGLALDRLEEFGLSREDLEEMTQMISRDLMGLNPDAGMPLGITPKIVKVEHVMDRPFPLRSKGVSGAVVMADLPGDPSRPAAPKLAADASAPGASAASGPAVQTSAEAGLEAAQADASSEAAQIDAAPEATPASEASPTSRASGAPEAVDSNLQPGFELSEEASKALAASAEGVLGFLSGAARNTDAEPGEESAPLNYDTIAGYGSTVSVMRDLGIGVRDDAEFADLVKLLNARHGLDRMPPADTFLFRSPAREDANRFIAATVGELGRPALRMHMEESLQGLPMLCVTATVEGAFKGSSLRNAFDNGGVLVLEDLDLWGAPLLDSADEPGGSLSASVARGVHEAVNLIRSAVDNPDVFVLASASGEGMPDGFFLDLLEPITVIDIDYPTPEERVDIWMDIAREHPSLRGVNRADLVRLSANMPRYDIYLAAREAIEEAYKIGVSARRYQAVTRDNLFDKLAAYQPLESNEYHELEEAVVRDFRRDFDQFESYILGGLG